MFHHSLAGLESCDDFDQVARGIADLDLARLESAVADRGEHDLPFAGIDDRVGGNAQRLLRPAVEDHLPEHLRPQLAARVGEGQAHLGGARPGVEHRLDEPHPALEGAVGQRGEAERDGRAELHARQVGLVRIGEHPNLGQIGDLEWSVARYQPRPLDDALRRDYAGDR